MPPLERLAMHRPERLAMEVGAALSTRRLEGDFLWRKVHPTVRTTKPP